MTSNSGDSGKQSVNFCHQSHRDFVSNYQLSNFSLNLESTPRTLDISKCEVKILGK